MNRDPKFTAELQEFINTPEEERDYAKGNLLLLQLSNNKIRFANFSKNPKGKAQFRDYQLRKYLSFRLAELTHEQVQEMSRQVEEIDAKRGLDKGNSQYAKTNEEFKAGKRADHDTLPEGIQALYIENLSILQKMRELHLQLRSLSLTESPCPDSERYPFVKEIIALDKQLHDNWNTYDHWTAAEAETSAPQTKDAPRGAKAKVKAEQQKEAAPDNDNK